MRPVILDGLSFLLVGWSQGLVKFVVVLKNSTPLIDHIDSCDQSYHRDLRDRNILQ